MADVCGALAWQVLGVNVDERLKSMRWTTAAVGISFFNMLFLLIALVSTRHYYFHHRCRMGEGGALPRRCGP